MMLYPSIQQLTSEKVNRYALVIATAKCARYVTYQAMKEREKLEERRESDRINSKDYKLDASSDKINEKAVTTAISRIYSGEYVIEAE